MISPTNPARLDAARWRDAYRLAVIVCSAMLLAVFVYAAVVSMLQSTFRPASGPAADITRMVIFAAAFATMLSLRWIRAALLKRDAAQTREVRVARLVRTAIITAAACEAPAVMGFVLFIIGAPIRDFYLLAALSAVAGIVYFPRWSQWQGDLRSVTQ